MNPGLPWGAPVGLLSQTSIGVNWIIRTDRINMPLSCFLQQVSSAREACKLRKRDVTWHHSRRNLTCHYKHNGASRLLASDTIHVSTGSSISQQKKQEARIRSLLIFCFGATSRFAQRRCLALQRIHSVLYAKESCLSTAPAQSVLLGSFTKTSPPPPKATDTASDWRQRRSREPCSR